MFNDKRYLLGLGLFAFAFSFNAQAECVATPSCPSLGFSVDKSSLSYHCPKKTYIKCPFGDYYFCSQAVYTCSEKIESMRNGIQIANGNSFTSSYLNNRSAYLMTSINSDRSSLLIDNYTEISSAAEFSECKNEVTSPISVKLYAVSGKVGANLTFNVPLTTNTITIGSSGTFHNLTTSQLTYSTNNTTIFVGTNDSGGVNKINSIVIGDSLNGSTTNCTVNLTLKGNNSLEVNQIRVGGKCQSNSVVNLRLDSNNSKFIYQGSTYTQSNCSNLNRKAYIRCFGY